MVREMQPQQHDDFQRALREAALWQRAEELGIMTMEEAKAKLEEEEYERLRAAAKKRIAEEGDLAAEDLTREAEIIDESAA